MTYEEKLDEVLEWQKQQAEKDRRIKELEAQIEKMKCCENCKNRKWDKKNKEFICGYVCKNREYWELRR